MVKRLLLLSLLVLALCGVSAVASMAGGPPPMMGPACAPPPPCPPPVCGPASYRYEAKREYITPVPAQLRKVRVVVPYLAGIAWPRKPLAFFGNPQSYPNPFTRGRWEWLVPVAEAKWNFYETGPAYWKDTGAPAWAPIPTKVALWKDDCEGRFATARARIWETIPRCVYVKANYIKCKPVCPPPCPVPMAPPPPMPMKVKK
jgi:hypothetical protein